MWDLSFTEKKHGVRIKLLLNLSWTRSKIINDRKCS
jgi:hypothetical protein